MKIELMGFDKPTKKKLMKEIKKQVKPVKKPKAKK